MRTAIIGSKQFEDYEYFLECLNSHPVPISSIVSGGQEGSDQLAKRYAKENNLPLTVLKSSIEIAENCEQVIAFSSLVSLSSSGAGETMKEAKKRDIACFLFYETFQ